MISITEILINNAKLTYAFKKNKNIYKGGYVLLNVRKEMKLKKWENKKREENTRKV